MSAKRPAAGKNARTQLQPQPKTKKAGASHVAWTGSLALVVIDELPIRKAALKAYEKAEKQLAQAREDLEAFETGDLPAFSRWEAQVFGALMSEIRETHSMLESKQQLLQQIEEEMFWTNCNRVTAYRRVMEAKNNPTPVTDPEPPPGGDGDPDFDPFGDGEDGFSDGSRPKIFGDSDLPPDFDLDRYDRMNPGLRRKYHDAYEEMAGLFEQLTGIPAPYLDDLIEQERAKRRAAQGGNRGSIPTGESNDGESPRGIDRVKELYRTLVRRLHPDLNGAHTARERDLWQQLQEAYRTRDLEWLEAIAGRVEAVHRGAASLSIQILRRMTKDLKDALHGIRTQLSRHRRHPAWKFREQTAALEKFEKKRRRELEEERARIKSALQFATAELEFLAERANRPPKGKKAKKAAAPVSEQDWFPF